jgi:ubiquinone/menaquinone biosynthesis C-methylase UbiE
MARGHKFNPDKLEKLRDPDRLNRENPEIIWERLGLESPECFIDVGAGIGFTAIPFAGKMPAGIVWACDINLEMLAELKEELDKNDVTNVKMLLTAESRITLPDSIADSVLMLNLYHELENPGESLAECSRLLKPGGRLAIVDWKKEETPMGPKVEHRVSAESIEADLKKAGFADIRSFNDFPYHSFLTADRPS